MSENLHDIDQFFKNGLEGYQEEPGRNVWEALDNQLDKVETVSLRRKYTQLRYWTVAVTVVLTSAVILLYNSKQNNHSGHTELTRKDSPVLEEKNSQPAPGEQSPKIISPDENNAAAVETTAKAESNPPADEFASREYAKTQPVATNVEAPTKTLPIEPGVSASAAKDKNLGHREEDFKLKKSGSPISKNFKNNLTEYVKTSRRNKKGEKTVDDALASNVPASGQNLTKQQSKNRDVISYNANGLENELYLYHSLPKKAGIFTLEGVKLPNSGKPGILPNLGSLSTLKIDRKHLFAFSAYYAPENLSQRLEEGKREHDEDDKDAIKNGESVQTSYSYGILGSYTITSKLSLQTGIAYLHKISTIAEKQIFARKQDPRMGGGNEVKFKFNCAAGYTYIDPKLSSTLNAGDSIKVSQSTNELSYVEVPLLLNYQMGSKKFHFNILGGLSASFLQKGTIQTSLVSSTGGKIPVTNTVQGLKQQYFSAMLGAGLEYELHPTISIFAQEVFKGSLESINLNAPTKTYANGTGLQFGLRYKM